MIDDYFVKLLGELCYNRYDSVEDPVNKEFLLRVGKDDLIFYFLGRTQSFNFMCS